MHAYSFHYSIQIIDLIFFNGEIVIAGLGQYKVFPFEGLSTENIHPMQLIIIIGKRLTETKNYLFMNLCTLNVINITFGQHQNKTKRNIQANGSKIVLWPD